MADLTVTVKPSGGDYTSLSAAFAGVNKDLVGNSRILTIECYDLGSADAACDTGTGWNTDSTHYLHVKVPTAQRHAGKWNTSKYRIVSASEYIPIVSCQVGHSIWEGLQIHQTATTSTGASTFRCRFNSTTNFTRLINCILRGEDSSTVTGILYNKGGICQIYASLIYGAKPYGVLGEYDANSAPFYARGVTVCAATRGFNANGGGIYPTNCYAGGHSDADFMGTYLGTLNKCGSSDLTGTAGYRSIAKSVSAGAYFVNVTPGSEDFSIGNAASALVDVGDDQSSYYTVDAAGNTITGTYDIGAFAYTGAAPSSYAIPRIMRAFFIPNLGGANG